MSIRHLIVGGVIVPLHASLELSQRYEKLQSVYRPRTRSGSRKSRKLWGTKLRTVITGSGSIPAGIGEDGLIDYDNPFTLSCVEHRAVTSIGAVTSIVLPAARRSDSGSEPYGRALVGDHWIATPVVMAGDTANLTPVANAVQYQAVYFPELVVSGDPPEESKPERGPNFAWTLTLEEVG